MGGESLALTLCELQAPFFVSSQYVMHRSFVSPDPSGPGNSDFQNPAKSPALRGQICGKILDKMPLPPGVDNNE